MPFSDPDGKPEIISFIESVYRPGDWILDVGPGAGTYARLLRPLGACLDAVEIFEPYVNKYRLRDQYKSVFIGSIVDFVFPLRYRVVILGDVLEHLSTDHSQVLVSRLRTACDYAVVSVPWTYPQGPLENNENERHLQDDLTPEVMTERYPTLVPFYKGPVVGLYYLRGI